MAPALSIILPSYNDVRIGAAIDSIRRFDDIGTVKLVVIDGGSRADTLTAITSRLRPGDDFVTEPDGGIFDALNKGLDRLTTPYMGWLGSDDRFTGNVPASEVVAALADADLFITSLAMFRGDRVRRITHSWPSSHGLAWLGLHNPHYATFGTTAFLASRRFDLVLKGSDIAYFLDLFAMHPRVVTTNRIGTVMSEGGFSTASKRRIIKINRELFDVYRRRSNRLTATAALMIKLGYKSAGLVQHLLLPRSVASLEHGPMAAPDRPYPAGSR